jgi:hypothetical protein
MDFCPSILNALLGLLQKPTVDVDFVYVGAGTFIRTHLLDSYGVNSATIEEPNDDMRATRAWSVRRKD